MRPSPLDRKLLRDLWSLRGQLFAISLVVASGVATFVTMQSTLGSLSIAMDDSYARQVFADVFARLERAPERVKERLAQVPGVAAVDTRVVAEVTLDVEGATEAISGRMVSIPDDDRPHLIVPHVVRGRLPEPGSYDEVAVSDAFAKAHGLLPGDTLEAVINERSVELRLVGEVMTPEYVYALAPGSVVPDDRLFGILWARRKMLAASFNMEGAFNDVVLTVARGSNIDGVLRDVDKILDPYGGLTAIPRVDQESHWFLTNEFNQLRSLGSMLPAIFLAVATFLFAVVLSRMIAQQREEIAVMKAFGYHDATVGMHFGKLVVVVAVLAAVLGLLAGDRMGSGMVDIYRQYFRFPDLEHRIPSRLVVLSIAIAFGAAVFGAARAVKRAAGLPPAEAMRPPAPPTFKPTTLERLGLGRRLPVAARIVLRNIERQPVRSGVSVLGTASGGALLLAGLSMVDSIDRAMDLQFRAAQREDVTVTLGSPRAAGSLGEFARLPGVRHAEPFRIVASRLRSGPRSRRVAIEGFTPGGTLRPPIDESGRPRPVPDRGIVLTEKLADVLGVVPGDRVIVEILEGERPVVDVEVTDTYASFVGLSARMDATALSRLVGEGPSLSGAHLLIDVERKPDLDRYLKETPLVAGVGSRLDALRRFEESTAESMGFMAFFLVFFASVLVVGVVYNDARVALAERGRELASMRVLGYRRSEISAILLGELWLLALIAIPVGLGLGWLLAWATLQSMDSELFQLPLVVYPATYARVSLVVAGAAVVAGLVVRRRLDHLDMIEVLKTRA
ncbi:MAG: FtsX-like permease family protein [Planctomycetota bacterium]